MTPVPNAAKCLSFVWDSIPKPAGYLDLIGLGTPGVGSAKSGFFDGGVVCQWNRRSNLEQPLWQCYDGPEGELTRHVGLIVGPTQVI